MSKAHRGKGIRELFAHGRGVCPVCEKSNIKTLYEQEAGGQKFKICKVCRAAIKNGTKKLPVTDAPPAEEPKAEASASTPEPVAKPAVTTAEPASTEDASAEDTAAEEASAEE